MHFFKNLFITAFFISMMSCSTEDNEQQKVFQLNAIYGYQFKYSAWEPTQRDSFFYTSNTVTEYFDFYNKDTKDYYTSFYYVKTYSTACKDDIIRRDDYTVTNGIAVNNIINYYEINNDCHLIRESKVTPAGDSTYHVEYLNQDAYGNAGIRKYYRRSPNGSLSLDFEDQYIWTYYPDNNIKSHTINRKKNNITTPFNKSEYTYTPDGKLERYTFSTYETASGQFKKTQENLYIYTPSVNVLNTTVFNNPNGTSQIIRIDSSFLDKNSNIFLTKTWLPVGTVFSETFKTEYFYTEK